MKSYHIISGTLFGIVALVHLLRLVYQWPIEIGSWSAPMSISWLGFVIPACLCIWAFRLMPTSHH